MRKRIISDEGLAPAYLVKNTPGYIRFNGDYVTVTEAKQKQDRKTGLTEINSKTRTNMLGGKPHKHVQKITLLGGAQDIRKKGTNIKVHCDCEFHMYTCEVALHRYGAADIINSNGEFPYQTNPKGIPLVCKHLYTVLKRLTGAR